MSLVAQNRNEKDKVNTEPYTIKSLVTTYGAGIRFAPMNIASINPAIQLGIQYPVATSIHFQHEFGLVFPGYFGMSGYNQNNPNFMNIRGFKFRNEIKNYLASGGNAAFYLSIEYLHNYSKYERERTFAVNVTNFPGTDFYQLEEFSLTKKVHGGHIKIGWEIPAIHRIHIDGFIGLGIRHVKVSNDLPELLRDAEIINNTGFFSSFFINAGNEWRPSGTLGFTIIYRISKKINHDKQ